MVFHKNKTVVKWLFLRKINKYMQWFVASYFKYNVKRFMYKLDSIAVLPSMFRKFSTDSSWYIYSVISLCCTSAIRLNDDDMFKCMNLLGTSLLHSSCRCRNARWRKLYTALLWCIVDIFYFSFISLILIINYFCMCCRSMYNQVF